MKVFISWSGARSKAVAELLGDWLSCVLQNCRPWISTRDIDRGSLWFSEIHDQLKDTSVGVVVLTLENRERPWILFEAGALAKGLTTSRVCTLLVDLQAKDVEDPLAQFNHTTPDKEGIKNLIFTLNAALGENKLRDQVVTGVFETYWPQFETGFKKVLDSTKPGKAPDPRPDNEVLGEILEATRSLGSRLRDLENRMERERFRGRERPVLAIRPEAAYDKISKGRIREVLDATDISGAVRMDVVYEDGRRERVVFPADKSSEPGTE